MTRSRAKRQQQRQVEILIDICHRKFYAHWDQYDDDACTRMMVMDIYDAALGEAGREVTTVLKYPPEIKKVPDDLIIFSKIMV